MGNFEFIANDMYICMISNESMRFDCVLTEVAKAVNEKEQLA